MVTPQFGRLARPFARGLLDKARALDELDLNKHQAARLTESLSVDVRKLCDILVPAARYPEVSQRAAALASALGIDLRVQTWHAQPKFDPSRIAFHYEHMNPVAALVASVRTASDADEVVEVISAGLRVAWITKDEDKQLTALGFKYKRPDPESAYAAAGIALLPPMPDSDDVGASPAANELPNESAGDVTLDEFRIAATWVEAASWFVASELVRRHPDCVIVPNNEPEGLGNDRLWVASTDGGQTQYEVRWSLNRALGGAVHVGSEFEKLTGAPWLEFFASPDPRDFVGLLEAAARLQPTERAKPTTARSLTYRVIATLLHATATSRTPLRCINVVGHGYFGPSIQRPQPFVRQLQHLPESAERADWQEAYRWWLLFEGDDPVALLHDSSYVWTLHTESELMAAYVHHERRLWPVLTDTFGHLLR